MPKTISIKRAVPSVPARATVSDLKLVDFSAESTSPFAQAGYTPDPCRGYIEFEICHSLPALAGPVQAGNFVGYYPETLAASHQSLRHQQFNLNHKLAAYAPPPPKGQKQSSAIRDRIVGCVIATYMPPKPMGGWLSASNPTGGTACIKACAVVFKLAEGMPKVLGEHLTSRVKQSVSIECTTPWANIGVLIPSRNELMPVLEVTEEVLNAVDFNDENGNEYTGLPHFGKLESGEQLVVVYGAGGQPIQFQGVGMTARPAERTAKIVHVSAERGGGEMAFMAAEEVNTTLAGREVRFLSGRVGKVESVISEGVAKLGGLQLRATVEEPVLRIVIGRDVVLKELSAVAEQLV